MIAIQDCCIATAAPTVAEYRRAEWSSTTGQALVAEATFCALERAAVFCPVEGKAMLVGDQPILLDAEMRAYLVEEAQRRGVDILTVYEEEMAAKAELARVTPRNADLLLLADRFPAPQEWYDE